MQNAHTVAETKKLLAELAARTDLETQARLIIEVLVNAGPQCCTCCDGDGDYRELIRAIRDALPKPT